MSHHKKGDQWLEKVIGQAEHEYLSQLEKEELEKKRKERNRRCIRQFVSMVFIMGLAGGFLYQEELTAALGIEIQAEEEYAAESNGDMVSTGSKGMLAALDESIAAEAAGEDGAPGKKGKKGKFHKIKQSFERIEYASVQAEKRANILNEIEEEMGMD